jgi:hypothetical protein
MYDDVVLTKLLRQDRASHSGCRGYFPSWLVISALPGLGNAAHGSRVDGHA